MCELSWYTLSCVLSGRRPSRENGKTKSSAQRNTRRNRGRFLANTVESDYWGTCTITATDADLLETDVIFDFELWE